MNISGVVNVIPDTYTAHSGYSIVISQLEESASVWNPQLNQNCGRDPIGKVNMKRLLEPDISWMLTQYSLIPNACVILPGSQVKGA